MPSSAPERTNQETLGTLSRARKSSPFIIQLHFVAKCPGPGDWLGPPTPHLGVRRPRRSGVGGGTPGKHAEARGGACGRGLARPPPCRPLCSRALVLLSRLRGVGRSPLSRDQHRCSLGVLSPHCRYFCPCCFPLGRSPTPEKLRGGGMPLAGQCIVTPPAPWLPPAHSPAGHTFL